ncbi:unnamed protein product [Microthlaspi erraticum]|uniref:Uncharacterized protein n=1 Tax=Microthlaspi erraticum TaxID=1685480 RepID=A0A6D2K2X4_9BRAS|nr:unnamed protein product [Microthlaspi erraticum]
MAGTWDGYMAYNRMVDQNLLGSFSPQPSQVAEAIPSLDDASQIPDPLPVEEDSTDEADLMTLDQLLRSDGRASLKKLDPRRMNGAGWFQYTKGITKTVKNIIESDFKEPAPNVSTVSNDSKLRWFKAFAQKYNWQYEQTTLVREEFDKVCGSSLRGMAFEWKKAWKEGKGKEKGKPHWMRKSVWLGLIAYWTDEHNANRAITNSTNKKCDQSKHTCGSASYVRKREEMRDPVTGELPDMVTFMEMTHKRKSDGKFVCKKAERIVKKCRLMEQQVLTQKTQCDENGLESNHLTPTEIDVIFRKNCTLRHKKKLNKAEKKMEEWSLKVQDYEFWNTMMQNKFPDEVPPSMRATLSPDQSF